MGRVPGRCPWSWLRLSCVKVLRGGEGGWRSKRGVSVRGPGKGCGHPDENGCSLPHFSLKADGDTSGCVNWLLGQFLWALLKEGVPPWVKTTHREFVPGLAIDALLLGDCRMALGVGLLSAAGCLPARTPQPAKARWCAGRRPAPEVSSQPALENRELGEKKKSHLSFIKW